MRTIKKFIIKLVLTIICFVGIFSIIIPTNPIEAGSPWEGGYAYNRQLTVTNPSGSLLTLGYSTSVEFDHAAFVTAGKAQSDGDDIRVVFWNGSAWVELDRALDLSTSWNTTTTKIWFKTQADISASGTDTNYYLFYGNPSATAPTYDWNVGNLNSQHETIREQTNNVLANNHATWPSGTEYWRLGTDYNDSYAVDQWYMFTGYTNYFTPTQIKNYFNDYIAQRINSSPGPGQQVGDFPITINPAGGGQFFSGCDTVHAHTTGDSSFVIPMMEKLYYDLTSDSTEFAADEDELEIALLNIERDPVTKLVNIPDDEKWIPWGFHDGIQNTGNDLMGSLLYYKAAQDMSAMYTVIGNTSKATFFTNEANDIKNNLTTQLYNSGEGMFHSATGQNNQIDVLGSAYAVYLGITTPTQTTAISNYIVTNYSSLVVDGYVSQSPSPWVSEWGDQCGRGQGNYDEGRWAVGNEWVAYTILQTDEDQAKQMVTDFINNPDMGDEYIGATMNGSTRYLVSYIGMQKFASDQDLFPPDILTANFDNVFHFWDDFGTTKAGWTSAAGDWDQSNGRIHQVVDTENEDMKYTHDAGYSNNLLVQGDFRVDTTRAGDHSTLGICINSLDTGNSSARGYCSILGRGDLTKAWILHEEVAWGTGANFNWSVGEWYRTQISRVGSTISRKTWAVGDPEPANWEETFTDTSQNTDDFSLLSGYATTSYENVLVRRYVGQANEPTVTMASESANISVSNISASGITTSAATITWDSSIAGSSQVEYGTTTSYGTLTPETDISPRVTSHSVNLSLLNSCTTYHYRVLSEDANGITGISSDQTFQTAGCDTTAPTGTISIDGGNANTADQDVLLSITASDNVSSSSGIQMKVSENSSLTGASYEAYVNSKAFTLSAGDETKTVYIRFKDEAGNESTIISDSILLDSTAPSVPGTPSTGSSSTSDSTPTWTWTASTDGGSGLATNAYSVQWCSNSLFTGCGSNVATSTTNSYTHSTAFSDSTWYFRVKATDAAGNQSAYSSNGSVTINTTVPAPTETPTETPTPTPEETIPTSSEVDETKTYSVTIKIVDLDNEPVAGAKVTLFSQTQEGFTASDGTITFQNVEGGQHKVVVSYQGYVGEQVINISGDVKEIKITITIKPEQNSLQWETIAFIVALIILVGILVILLFRKKTHSNNVYG